MPLLQSNLVASARNIGASLALTPADRCLNVMPLFHIHGLIAAVTASLAAGASIWCAPGFDALKFFGWMKDAKPTWYTAVPTMHQAILSRAPRNQDVIEAVPLRFLRSSSASLPAQVMLALADTFKAPVIEAYGMTEATHQMASNPLPPRAQKPGSVGVAAGPLVRIAHEVENRLIDGTGEVVISGPNVTPGYEGNPTPTPRASSRPRAGAGSAPAIRARFDDEGYLSLTGRLKEIINRGGEKISPLEVDGVLLDHPAIRAGGGLRHAASQAGRRGGRCRGAARRPYGHRTRDPRFRGQPHGGFQGAAPGHHPGRNPQGRDRQAAAHRAGREAGPGHAA